MYTHIHTHTHTHIHIYVCVSVRVSVCVSATYCTVNIFIGRPNTNYYHYLMKFFALVSCHFIFWKLFLLCYLWFLFSPRTLSQKNCQNRKKMEVSRFFPNLSSVLEKRRQSMRKVKMKETKVRVGEKK